MSAHFTSTLEIIEQTAEATLSSDVLQVKLVFNGTESIKSLGVPLSECWKDLSWYFEKYTVNDPYVISSAEDIRTRIAKSHAQIFEDLELARIGAQWVVRRKVPSSSPETVPLPAEKTNFNILCVVTRKHNSEHSGLGSDIAYHNVAIPIVDAVGRHSFVNVYLSRPGTFQAFQEHLEWMPEGFYDIIHFDLHGTLRGKNTECRPFLGFAPELPTSHGLNYIEASQVAQVLVAHKACAVTLNACYSVHGGAAYSNLARTFVQHGVPRVLGMSYTLVESAAPLLVSSLFRATLFDNMPFSIDVQACRRALANDQVRASRFRKTVQLDDFLVPVLYYSGLDISMKLTKAKQAPRHEMLEADLDDCFMPFRHTGASASPPERSWRWRNGTPSLIGFAPRNMNILSIERNILCSSNGSRTLMLYGPAGAGKTSLLLYLADWWETTNFILGSSYIDFDADDALTNLQTIECILAKLVEDIGRMSPTYPKDIEPEVPLLEKTLAMIRKKLVRDFGESIVIISTRRKDLPKKWLPGIEFRTYELSGLPLFASIEIAVKILTSNGSEQPSMDDLAFIQHLVQLLDCNPGALEVVLPFLAKMKKPPENLFRLLLNGSLFADSRELIRMEFPPSLFTNLGKLMYNANHSIQKVILFTSQLWKRMPREPRMFDTYIILAATDFNIQDLSAADNVDLFEVKELREKLRRPKLDPTMGHACYTVSREVQQVMVDLGWWILETETYYRVNPLRQIFLQRRRTELDLHQQSFTQLEEAIGTEVARALQYIPPPLSTESFERAFVVYHGLLRSWFSGLLTAHFGHVKGIVQKEFYNLIKALDLAALSLPLLDRCWPHELAGFLASFALIPVILSKTDQLLVNSSIERILKVYEMHEQKYNPPALPGQLLGIALGLFHIISSYYSVSKPFKSWIKIVNRSLAVAERARAVHGPLSVVDERKRRNLLWGKGQQLKARGDLQAAKEIFRDNLDSALQLDVTDEKGPEGLSYQAECYTRLAAYSSLPNLSDDERQQASRQARKAIINVIKLNDNLELSTFMEHSILLRQDDDFTPLAELPTRPVIPRLSFETGYPELLEELQVNRGHD
ncbi:hypothetical protein G7Y89_g7934 [Cudoniella acicularis]|uniref:CHAT domain-containing protein n=1 Tax=Cudoniella acicularis TaxID=354080 RepID=A0A8H4RK94_9HELO|nr:hypothetical protein G7Y89_g7934 [Cudoniella acicularis]